jgi:hypothetical protein
MHARACVCVCVRVWKVGEDRLAFDSFLRLVGYFLTVINIHSVELLVCIHHAPDQHNNLLFLPYRN